MTTFANNQKPTLRKGTRTCAGLGLCIAIFATTGCTIGDPEQRASATATPTMPSVTPTIIDSAPISDAPDTRDTRETQPATGPVQQQSGPADAAGLQAELEVIVNEVQSSLGGHVGVATQGAGGIASAGTTSGIPAWSTIKVPIGIAALRNDPGQRSNMLAAITYSDNAAAQAMWDSLLTPRDSVQAILAEAGDSTTVVNDRPLRPPYTVFGQTQWSLDAQVAFASNVACLSGAAEVLTAMGQVDSGQSYGLGTLPQARFKGGWGPDVSGAYDARQFGIVEIGGVHVPVALTAHAADGSYESAQALLSALAGKLSALTVPLAPANCV